MSAPPALPGVLAGLAPLLNQYGYAAIAGLITLEDFGVPAPGETVLIVGAIYAGAGQLNIIVAGLRQANGIIAGLTGMPWLRFLAYNALGAALWVGVWVSLGDLAGAHIDTIYPLAVRYQAYLGIAVGVLILALIVRAVLRRRRARRPAE